jgi:hypothetical protein
MVYKLHNLALPSIALQAILAVALLLAIVPPMVMATTATAGTSEAPILRGESSLGQFDGEGGFKACRTKL